MPGDYILCPRCELNYIKRGEEYCDVCKAELKKGPQLVFAIDEEEEIETMEICPKCGVNYLKPGESLCENCRRLRDVEEEPDAENDEKWKEFLDEKEEEEEESEEMLSLNKLAEEEGEKLFDEEEEEEVEESVDDEADDFEYSVNPEDFEDTEEEEEEEAEEDF